MFNLRTRVASAARAASFKRRRVDRSTLADYTGCIAVIEAKIIWAHGIDGESTPIYNRGMPRKVILGFGITLDGYIARRNGAMDYLLIDEEGEGLMADFFVKIDTTIMGRKTAAGWAKMRNSGEIPETPGMANYVVSRRWKPGKRDGFEVVSGSLTAFVRKLKRRSGKDIYLGGGGELARSFLQEDLVDELFIGLGPVLLGDGIPGFPGKFPQRDFTLTECKSYSNGSVGLRYERIPAKTSR
jgi:dihydrofolate reductase